ncbi:MAG: zinc ribbon domain-containing protein [Desulfobacteraceae bacterium]|nr:zinc ribbon domain-containing protein [Desulfobacteraceae bacterium]MCB9495177.1 zinc ribbon domain-containing protein [Desulfobacteraceae bacterium]
MPIYEYGCENCGKVDEVIQGISEEGPKTCRFCGKGPVKRLISKSSFHLKGTGWYVTDYGGKNSSGANESSKTPASVPAGSTGDNQSSGSEE